MDKNPEDVRADAPPLSESEWEHRVIKDICWSRGKGWSVETFLKDGITHQSIELYNINSKLHDMIRDSPHNVRAMYSSIGEEESDDDLDDDDESEGGSGSGELSGEDLDEDSHDLGHDGAGQSAGTSDDGTGEVQEGTSSDHASLFDSSSD